VRKKSTATSGEARFRHAKAYIAETSYKSYYK